MLILDMNYYSGITGECWKPYIPKGGVVVSHIIYPTSENLINGAFAGSFSTFTCTCNLGVLVPFIKDIPADDELFGNDRTIAYKDAVKRHVSLMAYNPAHEVHLPYHAPLSAIHSIKVINPGQTFKHKYTDTDAESLDKIFASQIEPAKRYVESLGYKPLNWKMFLILAAGNIIQANRERYVNGEGESYNPFAIPERIPVQGFDFRKQEITNYF